MVGIEDVNIARLCGDAEISFVFVFPDFKWMATIKIFVSSYWTDTYVEKCVWEGRGNWKEFLKG